MSGGLLKGPLPLLVIAGAGFFAYQFVPFGEIVARFRDAAPPAVALAPATSDAVVTGGPAERPAPADDAQQASAPPRALQTASGPASEAGDAVADPPASERPPFVPQPILVGRTPVDDAVIGPGETRLAGIGLSNEVATTTAAGASNTAASPAVPPQVTAGVSIARSGESAVVTTPAGKSPAATRPTVARATPARETTIATPGRPVSPKPAPVAESAPPPPPALRVLVEADNHARAGLDKYTQAEYARHLRDELAAIVAGRLGTSVTDREADNAAFRDDLRDGREGVERLCARIGAQRLLLADVSVPSAGFSTVPSAYWPEAVFAAINCADGRLHRSQPKRLEPNRLDSFEYQQDFARRSSDFVSSQGYFLKP